MLAASPSDLRMAESELTSNSRNHLNSPGFVPFGCFSSSPSHTYMYVHFLCRA